MPEEAALKRRSQSSILLLPYRYYDVLSHYARSFLSRVEKMSGNERTNERTKELGREGDLLGTVGGPAHPSIAVGRERKRDEEEGDEK